MLADWILSAAPGFDGEEDGDHEFRDLPPRMTAVSTGTTALRRNQPGTVRKLVGNPPRKRFYRTEAALKPPHPTNVSGCWVVREWCG